MNRRRRSLNDFHDEILCHVISFLPTKIAFQTSVLSKRWRFMWKSLPNLDFIEWYEKSYNNDYVSKIDRLKNFVERALCFDNAPMAMAMLNRFSLNCDVYDVSLVHKWISAALNRNVKELHFVSYKIYGFRDHNLYTHHALFTCKTLQVLKICHFKDTDVIWYAASGFLNLPSQISLPNLKKWNLRGVYGNCDNFSPLFASPALEELVLEQCLCLLDPDEKPCRILISAPKLQSLIIDDSQVINNRLASMSVQISAPLTKFYYHTDTTHFMDYQFSSSSSIVMATLLFHDILKKMIYNFDHFNKVLKSLQLVKYLELSACLIKGLPHRTLPVFKNLISLEISGDSVNLSCLKTFLNKCPHLETLKIPKGISVKGHIDRLLSPKFKCLSSLKNIMIGSVNGNTKELIVVHILLAKATSLETMEISVPSNMVLSKRKEIKTFFSGVPMGSKSCRLSFRLDGLDGLDDC